MMDKMQNPEDNLPFPLLDIPVGRTRHPSSVSFDLEKDILPRTGPGDTSRSSRRKSDFSRMSVSSQDFGLIKGGIGAGISTVTVFVIFVIFYNWWKSV